MVSTTPYNSRILPLVVNIPGRCYGRNSASLIAKDGWKICLLLIASMVADSAAESAVARFFDSVFLGIILSREGALTVL